MSTDGDLIHLLELDISSLGENSYTLQQMADGLQ